MNPFRWLLLPAALALAAPAAALPRLTFPPNAALPSHVVFVGHGNAGPDSATGHFTVRVRDLANNPLPGSAVELDFSACADLRIATDPLDPRLVVDCDRQTVTALTGPTGVAAFTVLGGSNPRAGTPGPEWLKICVDGVLAGTVPASAVDLNGGNGVLLSDLSWFVADYVSETNPGRSDFDGNGVVALPDLSIWVGAYVRGGSIASPAVYCA